MDICETPRNCRIGRIRTFGGTIPLGSKPRPLPSYGPTTRYIRASNRYDSTFSNLRYWCSTLSYRSICGQHGNRTHPTFPVFDGLEPSLKDRPSSTLLCCPLEPPNRFERLRPYGTGLQIQCNRPLCEGGI